MHRTLKYLVIIILLRFYKEIPQANDARTDAKLAIFDRRPFFACFVDQQRQIHRQIVTN